MNITYLDKFGKKLKDQPNYPIKEIHFINDRTEIVLDIDPKPIFLEDDDELSDFLAEKDDGALFYWKGKLYRLQNKADFLSDYGPDSIWNLGLNINSFYQSNLIKEVE